MIDFFFAVLAAGINSAGAGEGDKTAVVAATPVPVEAPGVAAPSGSPTVVIGENVQVGGGVVIGGTAAAPSVQGGGLSLLQGTADQAVAPAQAAPLVAPAPQASPFNMAVVPAGLVADPQTPSGKFTTATEVKPIMNATKGNWIAVREYNGQDLLYVTHIWGWRCGMHAMAISVNGEAMQNWPLPPCQTKYATPNAIPEGSLPYLTLKLGAVQTVDIQIVYDDLSMDAASFERGNVLIP